MSEERYADNIDGWAILELMGHRRLGGMLSEVQGGAMAGFVRIDIPGREPSSGFVATQFYSGASIYCITPVTEKMARAVARSCQPEPVQRWELAPAPSTTRDVEIEDGDGNDNGEDDSDGGGGEDTPL